MGLEAPSIPPLGWERFQRIYSYFSVRVAVILDVGGHPASGPQALSIGLSFACDVECRTVIGTRPDDGKACSEVYALAKAQALEWNKALIVVHGQDPVKLLEVATSEKSICSEGTSDFHARVFEGLNGRRNDGFLFFTNESVVPCMWVEAEYRNAGRWQTEVSFETLIEQSGIALDAALGNAGCDFFQGDVTGHDTDPEDI